MCTLTYISDSMEKFGTHTTAGGLFMENFVDVIAAVTIIIALSY